MLNLAKLRELTRGLPPDTAIYIKDEDDNNIPLDTIIEFSKSKRMLIIHSPKKVKALG